MLSVYQKKKVSHMGIVVKSRKTRSMWDVFYSCILSSVKPN